jgi:HSP20 family protein
MISIALKPNAQKPGYYVLEDIHNLPESVHLRVATRSVVWRPPTDVFETEDAVLVRVEIAGMEENDFSIVLDGRYLSIRGVRGDVPERRAYHQMEIRFGEFASELELPYQVSAVDIEAIYSSGFLQIRLPKVRPVRISVEE